MAKPKYAEVVNVAIRLLVETWPMAGIDPNDMTSREQAMVEARQVLVRTGWDGSEYPINNRMKFPKMPDFEFEAPRCVLCKKPIAMPGEAHVLIEGIVHLECM